VIETLSEGEPLLVRVAVLDLEGVLVAETDGEGEIVRVSDRDVLILGDALSDAGERDTDRVSLRDGVSLTERELLAV